MMQIFYAGVNLTKLIQEKYYKEPYKSDKINEISRDFPREKQNIDNLDIDKEIIKFFTNIVTVMPLLLSYQKKRFYRCENILIA